MIRRHPQDGATLVGRLDGYGPVADAILYHHERVDGSGYPAGLIGNEIPLASRIIAICSTYDTLTARETYRSPMTPQDAMAELRRVAGRQLDAELVESFIAMLEREGPVDVRARRRRRLRGRARVRAARARRSRSPPAADQRDARSAAAHASAVTTLRAHADPRDATPSSEAAIDGLYRTTLVVPTHD